MPSSQTIYTCLDQFTPNNFLMMDFSIHKVLIEKNTTTTTTTADDQDSILDDEDDGMDDSHLIFIINTILSGTARLNVLLPTATILAFTIFAPILTNDGQCDTLNRLLTGAFVGILAASCLFLSVTDSFRSASGRLYYGVATPRGIWTFNGGCRKRSPCVPSDYKLRWSDIFHGTLSLVTFLTFAAFNNDVIECYYPSLPRRVRNILPLVVGFVVSVLFVVFPTRRRGIGYPFLLRRDSALYYSRR